MSEYVEKCGRGHGPARYLVNDRGRRTFGAYCTLLSAAWIASLLCSANCEGGTYFSSAHGNSTSGVNRQAVTGLPYPDAVPYAVGHCGHCHEMHASVGGSEPTPPAAEASGATSSQLYSVFRTNYGANRNELCYACHETFNFTGTPDPPLGAGRYYVYRGKADYLTSTHNTSSSNQWPLTPPPGPTYLDAGNCNNCHNPHGYNDGTGVIPSMLFKREETLCVECHDGSPALRDVKTRVTTDTYRHNVGGYSGVHRAGTQDTFAYISANKHVECVDCHNPHFSASGLHTSTSDYRTANGNNVSNLLRGVLGAIATFSGSNWTTPASYSLNIATKEYQICFKCHAGANTNVTTWGGAGAAAWTNVALEFSTSNQSYHPVVGALPATDPGANGSSRLVAAQLTGGWAPGQAMYCSDCHNTAAAGAQGPHGSTVKWMLSGTNKAWPYQNSSNNGGSTGTYWNLSNRLTSQGTSNGLFCLNCHPDPRASGSNSVHKEGDHSSYECIRCHIRIPHGGKVSRLIADFGSSPMPARYYPNGNGGGFTTGNIGFIKRTNKDSYNKDDCATNCGEHTTSVGTREHW